VQVDDLAADDRWDRYRPHGVGSSLSLPLAVDGQVVGALNLYSPQRAAFAGPARQHTEAFAAQCAAALALVLRQADQEELHRQLGAALASRSIIDQAIGILMSQQRCRADEAFDLLRQASQHPQPEAAGRRGRHHHERDRLPTAAARGVPHRRHRRHRPGDPAGVAVGLAVAAGASCGGGCVFG
jgi:GAF domain-containing protein